MTLCPRTLFPLAFVFVASSAAHAALPALVCPQGTRLEGAVPPQGTMAWCTGPDLLGQMRRNGPIRRWGPNGKLVMEGTFVDGKKHGHWVEYDPRGEIAAEADYSFGRLLFASGVRRNEEEALAAQRPRVERVASTVAENGRREWASAAPSSSRESAMDDDWASSRRDDDLQVERGFRGETTKVAAVLRFDNTLASFQSAVLYAPQLDLLLSFGSFLIEAQWGVAVLGPPGADTVATSLNPLFVLGGALEYDDLSLTMGVGSTIPVLQLSDDIDSLLRIASAAMLPVVRGMKDVWLSLPEVPVVVIPIRGRYQREAIAIDFETVAYFGIPIHGGSSDLGLQLEGGATYAVDVFRFGGELRVVSVGITRGNFFLSVEPKVGVVLDSVELTASLSVTPVRPDIGPNVGLLWATNLGLQLTPD